MPSQLRPAAVDVNCDSEKVTSADYRLKDDATGPHENALLRLFDNGASIIGADPAPRHLPSGMVGDDVIGKALFGHRE